MVSVPQSGCQCSATAAAAEKKSLILPLLDINTLVSIGGASN
jgi:hypothetical protein